MSFVNAMTLFDFGHGASFALWSFRAIATGAGQCLCPVRRGFDATFGSDSQATLDAMATLAHCLGNVGGRKITLAPSGCCRVTCDEVSIIAILAAGQKRDAMLFEAHLTWLMCGKGKEHARHAAVAVAELFQCAGLEIDSPAAEISLPRDARCLRVFHAAGRA